MNHKKDMFIISISVQPPSGGTRWATPRCRAGPKRGRTGLRYRRFQRIRWTLVERDGSTTDSGAPKSWLGLGRDSGLELRQW